MERVGSLLARPGMRYLIIGGSVYLFEIAIIVMAQAAGATPTWSVALSFILGTLVSFFLQKLITFGDKRMHHKIVGIQLVAVCALVAWNFAFTVVLSKLLEDVLPAVLTRTIALAITTIWNFYLYKTRIFKRSEGVLVD